MVAEYSPSLSDETEELDDCWDCFHPEAVAHARQHLADDAAITAAADMFAVLGDGTRLRVITSLLHGELCVRDIAVATEVNRSTISHQLRVLRNNGMVQRRRDGKTIYYSIADEKLTHLLEIVAPGVCAITTESME